MARRSSRRREYRRYEGIRTSAPREGTVVVAALLWLIGFANVILHAFTLPNNLGIWALVVSGLLLILASMVDVL